MDAPMDEAVVSREQLAQLVDQAPIAMCVTAVPSLRILVANRQFLSLAGLPGDAAAPVGELPLQQPAGTLTPGLLPMWQQMIDSRGAFAKEEVRMLEGGQERSFEVTAVPMKRRDGSLWAIMTMVLDVTEREQAEAGAREELRLADAAYARETRIAARFQSALLPRGEIHLPGYALAHTYRPALLAEADVGGDFFNFFSLDGPRVAIVIGDVGGKGLEAAVVAARVQHSVIALALNGRRDPAAVLTGVRRVVTALEEPEQLVTLFFGILDWETGRLRYASAGHDPAFLWQAASGKVRTLSSGGPAIMGIAVGSYRSHEAKLAEGDLLFLYTDGLPEAHPRHKVELLGIERVAELVAECHSEEPAVVIERMYQAAVRHSQGYLRDDIALIAIRRLHRGQPPSGTAFVTPPARSPGPRPDE